MMMVATIEYYILFEHNTSDAKDYLTENIANKTRLDRLVGLM